MKKLFFFVFIIFMSCKHDYTPKPRGFFRIDFPIKEYKVFNSDCDFQFEYPVYGEIEDIGKIYNEPCWYNISFPLYKAKIHLTYKPIYKNLGRHIEDIHSLVYKHINKADDIEPMLIINDSNKVYGTLYSIEGNTASAISFYVTDSIHHFISGALYFSAAPNKDSLAPAIDFFKQDVVHLTESLKWE